MTGRPLADEVQTYLRSRDALAGLAERRERAASDALAEAAAELRRVEVEDRALRDRLTSTGTRLERLERDLALLARRADVGDMGDEGDVGADTPVPLEDVGRAVDFVRGLGADLDAARASWEWVERARARPTAPRPAPPQVLPSPVAAARPAPAAAGNRPRRLRLLPVLAGGALVVAIIVLAVVLKGL